MGQARGHTRERVPRRPPHSRPWTLKVTSGGDVRRISFSKSHTPSHRDVLSDVSDLFRVPPSRVESSFPLKYRDYEGDFCTLTNVTFSDPLPVFATDHTIRLTAAAGQQVQLMSTRSVILSPPQSPRPPPRYWSRVLQTDQAFHRDTVARRQAGAVDKWRIDHLADPASSMPGRPFSICAVTTRPGAFMRFVLHNPQEIRHSKSPSPTLLLRSSLALDLLCKSPEPKFVKAQCRVSGPKMRSSMLAGGSSNIRGARGTSRSVPEFPSSTSGIRGRSMSKAVKPTWLVVRWNPPDPDPWYPIHPT